MRKALTDIKYENIKAHILDPDNSQLSPEHQEILDRVISVAKVLDKNPVVKHAVSLHRSKFTHLSKTQAYEDARLAMRLYNSIHAFDYDFWLSWILNDISENIRRCRVNDTPVNRRIIAMEHANLLKAIGDRPEEITDPRRNEKHQFFIVMNIEGKNVKIDINQLKKIPHETLNELNNALFGGREITDIEAEEIMNT